MRKLLLGPIAATVTLAACQPAQRLMPPRNGLDAVRSCAPAATAVAEVDDAVRSLFVALAGDDDASVARITTPTFYAFEGERMSGPQLSAVIRKAHQAGGTYVWNIGPVEAHVDCNIAWATWENVGASGIAPALKPRHWLESAVLVHDGQRWLLQFMHSTPVGGAK